MNMKFIKLGFRATALILAFRAGLAAHGQTINTASGTNGVPAGAPVAVGASNTPPVVTTPGNAFAEAETWLTSFGTNTWAGGHGFIETGAAYQNQVNIASVLEIGYEVYKPSTNLSLEIAAETFNAGVAGTVLAQDGYLGLAYNVKDVQIVGQVGAGYNFVSAKPYPSLGVEFRKRLSSNRHAFIRIQEDLLGSSGNTPIVAGGFGADF
jgi:hypothetical protein